MKRIPCTAFFSVMMPETGEWKVSVRFASPDAGERRICSSEMSQLRRRRCRFSQLPHAGLGFAAGSLEGQPWMAMAYSRWAEPAPGCEPRTAAALADRLSGDGDVQAFDVTFELRGDGKGRRSSVRSDRPARTVRESTRSSGSLGTPSFCTSRC